MSAPLFVILGAMRTGSNFLEATLSEFAGVTTYGELFNPHFIGGPKKQSLGGTTLEERDADPLGFLARLRAETKGAMGFRLFDGHDIRVIAEVLARDDIRRVVLTRAPMQSYLSLKHAQATDQWRLGDHGTARSAKVRFDAAEYQAFATRRFDFYQHLRRSMQENGTTAFEIDYSELNDLARINGLARYLGLGGTISKVSTKTRRQIIVPESELIDNHADYLAFLAGSGAAPATEQAFQPSVSETTRGAGVSLYLAAPNAPLLFMPVRGGTSRDIATHLAGNEKALRFDQAGLRHWRRANRACRSFTLVRHPGLRLLDLYLNGIGSDMRADLTRRYKLKFVAPDAPTGDLAASLTAFGEIVVAALAGRTAFQAPAEWESQSALIRAMSELAAPDLIMRDEDEAALARLFADMGLGAGTPPGASLRDDVLRDVPAALWKALWPKDWLNFGYAAW